jgi:hypothetical protein
MRNIRGNRRLSKESGVFDIYTNIIASSHSSPAVNDTNIGNLKVVIDYFTSIRNKGKINDAQFSDLITNLCANFIANEIFKTFKETFGEYIDE